MSIFSRIKSFVFGDGKITPTGRVYNMWQYNSWGNRISWRDFEKRSIGGHCLNLRVGDELRCKMESGGVGRFIIIEIDYCQDPRDQFFGKVVFFGYFEDNFD